MFHTQFKLNLVFFTTLLFFSTIISNLSNEDIIGNKVVLILGGTGYLGREIAQEVLKYNPKRVIIYSRDEVKHFYFSQNVSNDERIQHIIGDIRDSDRLLKATRSVDLVFHVAALKRMDALESNVEEAIKTNLLGSINVMNACIANKVDKVLFISTDKACSPINNYGACKFVSEKLFTNYDTKTISTKFIVVRFGNILESTGSVIPIFIDKIKRGADITLTDERMTRFIISKERAVKLIFDALRYGQGGEIFIRNLPAMNILDLIELLKDKYKAANKITTIGMRPGEKLHEVLINESEILRSYKFQDYFILMPSIRNMNEFDHDQPQYMREGKRLTGKELREYSSNQEVLDKKSLSNLFDELGLLC